MKSFASLWAPQFDSGNRPCAAGSGHDQNVGRYTLRVGFSLAIRSQSPTLEAFCKCPVLETKNALFLMILSARTKEIFGTVDALFPEQIQKEGR